MKIAKYAAVALFVLSATAASALGLLKFTDYTIAQRVEAVARQG